MQLSVDVDVGVHGVHVLGGKEVLRDHVDQSLLLTGQAGTEGQAIDYVRQVGHRRVDVVVLGSHLDVEISRYSNRKE